MSSLSVPTGVLDEARQQSSSLCLMALPTLYSTFSELPLQQSRRCNLELSRTLFLLWCILQMSDSSIEFMSTTYSQCVFIHRNGSCGLLSRSGSGEKKIRSDLHFLVLALQHLQAGYSPSEPDFCCSMTRSLQVHCYRILACLR
jgi:hypothetical protein